MSDDQDIRNTRVVIYMTKEDSAQLTRMSNNLRFKSRSAFIVAMLERFIMGGFSVASFFKVGCQIERRADQMDDYQFEFDLEALKVAFRPLPELPPEEDPGPAEVRANLKNIREELVTK